jgi:hypothetical protein
MESAGEARNWKSVGLTVKLPALCDSCNSEWGSELETKMKSVVADMVSSGRPKCLNENEVAIIATFSLLKSFVVDYMREDDKSFYSCTERHSFRRDFTFPRGVQIWLASVSIDHGVFKASYFKLPLGVANRFELYVFTMSLGHLVIQIVSSRWSKKAHRRHAKPPSLTAPIAWLSSSIMVWPECDFPISWPPPLKLNSHALDQFVDRWKVLRR